MQKAKVKQFHLYYSPEGQQILHTAGEIIEVDEKDVERLVNAGAIELEGKSGSKGKEEPEEGEPEPEERARRGRPPKEDK